MGRQTRPAESRGGGASPFPAPGAAGEWAGWARLRPGGLLYGGTVGPASAHAHHSVQLIATLGEDELLLSGLPADPFAAARALDSVPPPGPGAGGGSASGAGPGAGVAARPGAGPAAGTAPERAHILSQA